MFNKDSAIVKIWVKNINDSNSNYTLEDVPKLLNLHDVVSSIVNQ